MAPRSLGLGHKDICTGSGSRTLSRDEMAAELGRGGVDQNPGSLDGGKETQKKLSATSVGSEMASPRPRASQSNVICTSVMEPLVEEIGCWLEKGQRGGAAPFLTRQGGGFSAAVFTKLLLPILFSDLFQEEWALSCFVFLRA